MQLSEAQIDALSELINIGFGRAASALSMMVGQRVILESPIVGLFPVHEMPARLRELSEEITTVHQVFTGQLSGDAMLLLDNDSAAALADLLSNGEGKPHPITDNDREALAEMGNILLNAFTGSFGNLLRVHIRFTVPKLRTESLRNMLNSMLIDEQQVEYGLVVRVNFRLSKGEASGYVMIVMNIQSIESLLEAMRGVGYLN